MVRSPATARPCTCLTICDLLSRAATIRGGFLALGAVAANDSIQWLSVPWLAPARLAVTDHYTSLTILHLLVSVAAIPMATWLLVFTDRWSHRQVHQREWQRLQAGDVNRDQATDVADTCLSNSLTEHWIYRWSPMALTISCVGNRPLSTLLNRCGKVRP